MIDLEERWTNVRTELLLFAIFSTKETDFHRAELAAGKINTALGALRLIQPFNWNGWLRERGGWPTMEEAKTMDLNDCVRTLTAISRSDRVCEGNLAGAIASGMVRELVERAHEMSYGAEVQPLPEIQVKQ